MIGMSKKTPNKTDPKAKSSSSSLGANGKNWRIGVGIVLFIMLAAGIFFAANRVAEKTAIGFPSLQDNSFMLRDQNNALVTPVKFVGRPAALFFGFTYCPDVCPMTLTTLTAARDELVASGVDAVALQIIFITVDPERDTPDQLKQYLELFDGGITGLTGKPDAVRAVLKQFGIFAQKTGAQKTGTQNTEFGDDYLYDHNAAVFLYRADGQFKGTIVHNEPIEFIREKLRNLLAK